MVPCARSAGGLVFAKRTNGGTFTALTAYLGTGKETEMIKAKSTVLIALAVTMAASSLAQAQEPERPTTSASADRNPAVKSPDDLTWGRLSKGKNSFTARQALGRFKKAGYGNVSHLSLDRTGLWQGSAIRHGRRVHVALDYKGNLAER